MQLMSVHFWKEMGIWVSWEEYEEVKLSFNSIFVKFGEKNYLLTGVIILGEGT